MSDSKAPVITVDGPGGSGKGTVTQMLARKLGWHLLDSGALYRLTALAAARQVNDAGHRPEGIARHARQRGVPGCHGQVHRCERLAEWPVCALQLVQLEQVQKET